MGTDPILETNIPPWWGYLLATVTERYSQKHHKTFRKKSVLDVSFNIRRPATSLKRNSGRNLCVLVKLVKFFRAALWCNTCELHQLLNFKRIPTCVLVRFLEDIVMLSKDQMMFYRNQTLPFQTFTRKVRRSFI